METLLGKTVNLIKQKKSKEFIKTAFNYLRYEFLKIWFKATLKNTDPDLKKVNKNWVIYTYLKSKYSKFIKNYKIQDYQVHGNSNFIWWCWFQGEENAPEITKMCLESVRRNFPGKEIIIITEKNMRDYVSFPGFIEKKYKKGIISRTHLSDILRLELLIKYGGLWIDSTVFCTAEPSYIYKTPLFMFKTKEKNDPATVAQSWFIYSRKNDPILILTKTLLYKYWQNHNYMIHYFLIYFFLKIASDKFKDEWERIPFFSDIPPHILQRELFMPFSKERFEQIKRMSDIHKLTYKFPANADFESKNTFYKEILNKLTSEPIANMTGGGYRSRVIFRKKSKSCFQSKLRKMEACS